MHQWLIVYAFQVHNMEVEGKRVRLSIWVRISAAALQGCTEIFIYSQDTAGQEQFRSVASSYYRRAQGVILGTFLRPVWIQYIGLNAPIIIQYTTYPIGRPSRPSPGGTMNLKHMRPNTSSRSSLATRLIRSVVLRVRTTSSLTASTGVFPTSANIRGRGFCPLHELPLHRNFGGDCDRS